jgi:hypothetical protein
MKKVFIPFFMALMLVSLGGCATYNSIAPDWAQIGAESSEATTDGESVGEADGEFTWWNPLSWF